MFSLSNTNRMHDRCSSRAYLLAQGGNTEETIGSRDFAADQCGRSALSERYSTELDGLLACCHSERHACAEPCEQLLTLLFGRVGGSK